MKNIKVSNETYEKIKDQLGEEKEEKRGVVIRNRYDNSEIYISKAETVKEAVEEAVKKGISLQEADLWGANLGGVNLRNSDLRGANLRNSNLWEASLGGATINKNQVDDLLDAVGVIVEG